MKLSNILFIHSHIFLENNKQYYSDGKLKYQSWKRYLNHCENLTVLGRVKPIKKSEIDKYDLSSGNNVTHYSMPNLSSIKRFKVLKEVKQIIKEHILKSELIVVRLPSEYGNIAIEQAKKFNVPYIVEVVGDVYLSYKNHGHPLAKLLAPYMAKKTKAVIKDSEYVLYVTEKYLQGMYPSKSLRISTACSNVMIDNDIYHLENKASFNKHFTIGLIGSYKARYKGIEDALKAIGLLKEKGIVCEFKILGNGEKEDLQLLAKELNILEQITFDGTVPAGLPVWNWLKSLDLYIQPSHTEGLPRALIEAMACGLPCIASNVGGIPELLVEEDMHSPKDYKRLAELIEEFVLDEHRRNERSIRNIEHSKKYANTFLEKRRYEFFNSVILDIKGD